MYICMYVSVRDHNCFKLLVKFTLRSMAAFMPACCPLQMSLIASLKHYLFIFPSFWLVLCSHYDHKRKQVCTKGGIFGSSHVCYTFFNTGALFVHTLCFMPSQISVMTHVHSTKWASFLSKAPIMYWKRSHCGLRAASQVLLAPCNSLLHWFLKFINLYISIILKVYL